VTEQEIKDWLGVGDVKTPLRRAIIAGMSSCPVPYDTDTQMATFRAFLNVSGPRGTSLWEKATMRWRGYDGNIFTTPFTDTPTAQVGRYVHRLIMPAPAELIPPVTWCGRAVFEDPGTAPADCPDCTTLLTEGRR
jgi:hypothetical protein